MSRTDTYSTASGKRVTSRAFASKLAVFATAAALAFAPALVAGSSASAAGPIVVTTPANGAVDVQQSFPNVVDFAGSNLPTTDYLDVKYFDELGIPHQGSFSGGTNDGSGNWTLGVNLAELSVDQTEVTAVVTALLSSDGSVDPNTQATTVNFTLALPTNPSNPFTVTQPASNSGVVVEDTTPTFAGTGEPGAIIEITYGARAGGISVAAQVEVDVNGEWTTETDFSDLEPGSIDGSAIVTEYTVDGDVFPGTSGQRINFVFPSAPAPAIPLTLTFTPASSTRTAATTNGVNFFATGFSPNEEVTFALTAPNGQAVPLVAAQTFSDNVTGSYSDKVTLLGSAGLGTYTLTVTGVRSGRVISGTFVVTADPAAAGTRLPVVSG